MNSTLYTLCALLSVAHMYGSDEVSPILKQKVVDEIRQYARDNNKKESDVKILFNDVDISNETKTFLELGVKSSFDLVYRVIVQDCKLKQVTTDKV